MRISSLIVITLQPLKSLIENLNYESSESGKIDFAIRKLNSKMSYCYEKFNFMLKINLPFYYC